MAEKMERNELSAALAGLPGWAMEQGEIVRTFQFPDFVGSMAFVNRVAELAEQAQHHPDIDIRYNRVRIALVTHDAGGITQKDIQLAVQVNEGL
jgi:4a-hydroxytetrahydrobiopterin dehydratase